MPYHINSVSVLKCYIIPIIVFPSSRITISWVLGACLGRPVEVRRDSVCCLSLLRVSAPQTNAALHYHPLNVVDKLLPQHPHTRCALFGATLTSLHIPWGNSPLYLLLI